MECEGAQKLKRKRIIKKKEEKRLKKRTKNGSKKWKRKREIEKEGFERYEEWPLKKVTWKIKNEAIYILTKLKKRIVAKKIL